MKKSQTITTLMRLFASTLALGALLSCGPGEPAPPTNQNRLCSGDFETFALGLSKSVGDFTVTLEGANPSPPVEGFNVWNVSITENGEARTDLAPTFQPWMPEHGHGANTPVASELEGDMYRSLNLDFFMPGRWETTLRFEAEGQSQEVIFKFCIN